MRFLFLGDIVGRPGRRALADHLPGLRKELGLDAVVVNVENAAAGFGITRGVAEEIFAAGADVLTGGNHSWDQREALSYIEEEPRLLRPANYPQGTPGRGEAVFSLPNGKKLLVINLLARLFMDALDDPFPAIQKILSRHRLGATVDAAILDFHGEATSEKMAMGHVVDGRVSLCVGTHTHVPTADCMILERGTAYQTDAGMCGSYDSVIGMDKSGPIERFTTRLPGIRLSVAEGEGTLCGVFVETDRRSGLAIRAEPVRIGGKLMESRPQAALA